MKIIARVTCYIAVALVVGVIVAAIILPKPGIRPIAKTKAIIECILYEIQRKEIVSNGSFVSMPGSVTNSIQINRTVAAWVSGDTNVAGRVNLTSGGLLVDAWGRPLNFERRSKKDTQISLELLNELQAGETNGLIVWSSGPNGTNEYGSGDDVFSTNVFTPFRSPL